MFDSIVLDVFIGLVLVYLLYSLFITIIGEMIVTWMGLRSRILRIALEKMLNDGYHYKKIRNKNILARIWNFIQRFFLREFKDFKYSFAGKFYANPSVKYLSSKAGDQKTFFSQTKPSYISADMFAQTLIQILKDKGNGANDMAKIRFCLRFNTHHIEPATLKNLRDMVENSNDDINVLADKFKAWYNETQDRATGWYKRKLGLILFWLGFVAAAMFNVDTIGIVKLLAKDREARNQLVNMGVAMSKDSTRYADFTNRKKDSLSHAIIDSGYVHITKDINEAGMVLGLGWEKDVVLKDVEWSCDSVKDAKKYFALRDVASRFRGDNDSSRQIKERLSSRLIRIDTITETMERYAADTSLLQITRAQDTSSVKPAELANAKKILDTVKNELQFLLRQGKLDSALLKIYDQRFSRSKSKIDSIIGRKSAFISGIDTTGSEIIVSAKKKKSIVGRIILPMKLLGLIITALMLSLGAPFWFDLLKRLVAIRGAGVKPEEKKIESQKEQEALSKTPVEKNGTGALPVQPLDGDMTDKALRTYGRLLMQIPGVKSVFKVFDEKKNQSLVQINVLDDETKKEVLRRFAELKVGETIVLSSIVISGVPKSQGAQIGRIANASGKNGFGTLGCVLRDKQSGVRHILSCWHVMKGNIDYDNDDNDSSILDHEDKSLAIRWAGGIDGCLDFALAECVPTNQVTNDLLKEEMKISKFSHRAVSQTEVNRKATVRYYDWGTGRVHSGIIYTSTPFVEIHYQDKVRLIEDVLVLTHSRNEEKTISQPGNSGSIVFDEKGIAIGMIIAGDFFYSYAIKLSNIFSLHGEMEILNLNV